MKEDQKPIEMTNTELEAAAGGAEYYIVQKGDNLTKIAKRFGTTWQKLKKCNGIANANLIYPDQVIKICY